MLGTFFNKNCLVGLIPYWKQLREKSYSLEVFEGLGFTLKIWISFGSCEHFPN